MILLDENDKIALEDQKVLLDETRDRIFSAMKSKGLSQKELATAIGASSQTVTDWKKGKSRSYMQKLPLIASILDTNLDWLCSGVGDGSTPENKESQAFDHLLEAAYFSRFVGYDGNYTGDLRNLQEHKKRPTVQDDGLSDGEQALLSLFRQLTPDQQDMVIRMVQAAADKM